MLLAGEQSGFATSPTWSTPSSQMVHPPRGRRHLREAVLPQALAPSLRAVRLPLVGFKAGGTPSSHCDRTAGAPPRKRDPLSRPPGHSKGPAGAPQETSPGQPQRTPASRVSQDSAQLQSHWTRAPKACSPLVPVTLQDRPLWGRGQTDLLYGLFATPGRKLARWSAAASLFSLPPLGSKGQGRS